LPACDEPTHDLHVLSRHRPRSIAWAAPRSSRSAPTRSSATRAEATTRARGPGLQANLAGNANIGTGSSALGDNTTGHDNLASGVQALAANATGINNVALGNNALQASTTANGNTAAGRNALVANTTGHDNVANGWKALNANTAGSGNIAIGSAAGKNLTTGSDNVDIASAGVAGESGTIRIGDKGTHTAAFLQGVYGTASSGGVPVVINSAGKLGTGTAARATRAATATGTAHRLAALRAEVDALRSEVGGLRARMQAAGWR
jgi:hypothetical protein